MPSQVSPPLAPCVSSPDVSVTPLPASPASSRPVGAAECFWSGEEELIKRSTERKLRRTSVGRDLDELISKHYDTQQKPHSWLHGAKKSLPRWQRQFRKRLSEKLVVQGALGTTSGPIVKSRVDRGDFIEERVEIALTPPMRTDAIVTIPKNGNPRHPCLVMLHCMGSLTLFGKEKLYHSLDEPSYLSAYRNDLYSGSSLLAEFAKAGYLCISIDALGFGSRSLPAVDDFHAFDARRRKVNAEEAERWSLDLYRQQCEQWARALGAVGLSVAAIVATDDLRTVDYLTTRDDVDFDRIGCMGLSFGSFRCNYLMALDDRVRAAASVCWISTIDGVIDYNLRDSIGFFALPGELYRDIDMVDIIIAAAPKPFLAISGWKDILMEPRGTANAHIAMRDAWKRAGRPEALGSVVLDAAHEFNLEMQEIARQFLLQNL